jgi:hypothetical protein
MGDADPSWGGARVIPDDVPRERDRNPELPLKPEERDPEASPADVAEQAVPADPAEAAEEVHFEDEASEWDAIEQARIVELDEEDHER